MSAINSALSVTMKQRSSSKVWCPLGLDPLLKILDVLLDIEYKPSIEGWSWCAGRLRSLYSFRFLCSPVPHEHSFSYPGLIARNPDTHGASCELV